MKRFSYDNLVSMLTTLQKRYLTLTSAIQKTFDEIYADLEDIDTKVSSSVSLSYDADAETLTIRTASSATEATASDETESE